MIRCRQCLLRGACEDLSSNLGLDTELHEEWVSRSQNIGRSTCVHTRTVQSWRMNVWKAEARTDGKMHHM
jgi:hypothetical protein